MIVVNGIILPVLRIMGIKELLNFIEFTKKRLKLNNNKNVNLNTKCD